MDITDADILRFAFLLFCCILSGVPYSVCHSAVFLIVLLCLLFRTPRTSVA